MKESKQSRGFFCRTTVLVTTMSLFCLASMCAQAAILSTNPVVQVFSANSGTYWLSVYPGKAAYKGLASGVFGDGTVMDYRFYNNATLATGGYANGGGGRVSTISYAGGVTDYAMDLGDVWTATDPGALTGGIPAFSTTADFGGTNLTMSGQQYVTNTVNVASMVTGTVYVLCGSYQNNFSVTLTMQGPGQPDLVQQVTIVPPSNRNTYIVSFGFLNPDNTYETIRIAYAGTSNTRARYLGVILDGQLMPAGTMVIFK